MKTHGHIQNIEFNGCTGFTAILNIWLTDDEMIELIKLKGNENIVTLEVTKK